MKKNTGFLVVIIILLCLLCVGIGFYLGSKHSDIENNGIVDEKVIENNKETIKDTEQATEVEQQEEKTEPISYVGNYGHKLNHDGEVSYDFLYLREDGTFSYAVNTYGCVSPSVGTYKVDENKILLTETVKYGCDACFYLRDLKSYEITIKDENTLVLESNEFIKNTVSNESELYKNRYVTNPADGVTPENNIDPWFDCTRGY